MYEKESFFHFPWCIFTLNFEEPSFVAGQRKVLIVSQQDLMIEAGLQLQYTLQTWDKVQYSIASWFVEGIVSYLQLGQAMCESS